MNFWVSSKLEMILNILVNCSCPFYRHAKRSTINTEDVKLLARRSNSLLKYITEKNEELTQFNIEQRAKKKKKLEDDKTKSLAPAEAAASGMDSSAPSPGAEAAFGEGRQEQVRP